MRTFSFDEFAELYCERQVCERSELHAKLAALKARFAPVGFALLECEMLDSSYLGNRAILPYGPNNLFRDAPTGPVALHGLASHTSSVIGVMPASEL